MKSSKWNKVQVPSYQGGMNSVIEKAMKGTQYETMFGNGFYRHELTVHSYRELGTAVEAAVEVRLYDDNNKMIHFQLGQIFL